jgi:hypothetical protein
VAFTDSRDAKSAMTKVDVLHPEWRITPLTAREYARRSMVSNPGYISDFEGQISLSVFCDGCELTVDHRAVASNMKDLVASLGDVKAFKVLPIRQDNVSDMEIEFHDVRDADNVVSTLNGAIVGVSIHMSDTLCLPIKLILSCRISPSTYDCISQMWSLQLKDSSQERLHPKT